MGVCDYGRLRLNVISRNDRMTLKFLAFVIAYGGLPLAPHMHRTSRHAAPKKQKLNFRGLERHLGFTFVITLGES